MARPITPGGEAGLSALIAAPRQALLAFDFDGVLSPIVDDPDLAQPLPGIFDALAAVGQQAGPVAIITGRPVAFVLARDGFDVLRWIPDFAIYGHYGLERWNVRSPEIASRPVAGDITAVRDELAGLLRQPGMAEGAWIEDKGSAVAVHTRRMADPAGALALLSEPVRGIARRHRLHVEPGKMVLEIRPPGIGKGDVLRELAAGPGTASVLYAGDDLGDLSAFAVVDELRAAGMPGVKVASASAEAPQVADAADVVVDGPPGIRDLLGDLHRQIGPA
jgi:trehalose 6-phosphate phosphatase